MQYAKLPFGEWLPDQPDFENPGLIDVNNAYPSPGGFSPFNGPVSTSVTTPEKVLGAENFFDTSNQSVVVAGSSTRLYTKRGGSLTTTTGYSAVSDAWRFARINDLIVATSLENDPQYLTDIDTANSWVSLPGSPPKAAQVGRVDSFLVFGDLIDIDGLGNPTVPNRVRWSAFNNPTGDWITDRGELSGYQDLDPRYGKVTAIVSGQFGLVFQERAVWRMVFVGAPQAFVFEPVLLGQGCTAGGSAVTINTNTYFQSQNGFMATNGSSYENITAERLSQWYGETISETQQRFTHGAVNWPRRCIVWAFKTGKSSTFDQLLAYNFITRTWSKSDLLVDYLVQTKVNAKTLADLAIDFPGGLGDASEITVGHEAFRGRDLAFAAFTAGAPGSVFSTLDGSTLEAEFVTGDYLANNRRSCVTGLWPVVETQSPDIKCQTRARDQHGGDIAVSAATTRAADGYCPQNKDGWLLSFRTIIPAGTVWDKAEAITIRLRSSGKR